MRKSLISLLVISMLLLPECGWPTAALAGQQEAPAPSTSSSSSQSSVQPQTSPHAYHQSRASRRSYARETGRKHRHITKGEIAFMAAIAGTSMGIGALAGGGSGLAIGAIVGGWGAYAGHRLWNKIRG